MALASRFWRTGAWCGIASGTWGSREEPGETAAVDSLFTLTEQLPALVARAFLSLIGSHACELGHAERDKCWLKPPEMGVTRNGRLKFLECCLPTRGSFKPEMEGHFGRQGLWSVLGTVAFVLLESSPHVSQVTQEEFDYCPKYPSAAVSWTFEVFLHLRLPRIHTLAQVMQCKAGVTKLHAAWMFQKRPDDAWGVMFPHVQQASNIQLCDNKLLISSRSQFYAMSAGHVWHTSCPQESRA